MPFTPQSCWPAIPVPRCFSRAITTCSVPRGRSARRGSTSRPPHPRRRQARRAARGTLVGLPGRSRRNGQDLLLLPARVDLAPSQVRKKRRFVACFEGGRKLYRVRPASTRNREVVGRSEVGIRQLFRVPCLTTDLLISPGDSSGSWKER